MPKCIDIFHSLPSSTFAFCYTLCPCWAQWADFSTSFFDLSFFDLGCCQMFQCRNQTFKRAQSLYRYMSTTGNNFSYDTLNFVYWTKKTILTTIQWSELADCWRFTVVLWYTLRIFKFSLLNSFFMRKICTFVFWYFSCQTFTYIY